MISLLLLLAGFFPLTYGANFLVDGGSSLARKFNIPNIVIGLTIVSFGTSAPELVVNVFGAIDKNSDIVMGNVLGSNIFNVLLILGVASLIQPMRVKKNTTWIEIPLSFVSALILFIMANDIFFDQASVSIVSRNDGFILLMFFGIFMYYNYYTIKKGYFDDEIPPEEYSVLKSIILVIGGLAFLGVGGRIVVHFAIDFARYIGMSEKFIAIAIVSVGTSLPELVTSVIAARKNNVDIAIGNVIGSNIFNIFLVLATSAMIYPVVVRPDIQFDLLVNMGASLLLFAFIFIGKGPKLDRWEGIIFIICYVAYITKLIFL